MLTSGLVGCGWRSDGTSSTVLLIGELLKQCERYLAEGLHPRVLVEGFEVAKKAALEFLEEFKTPMDAAVGNTDREMVRMVARTSLVSEALPCPAPSLSLSLSLLSVNPSRAPVSPLVHRDHNRCSCGDDNPTPPPQHPRYQHRTRDERRRIDRCSSCESGMLAPRLKRAELAVVATHRRPRCRRS